MQPYLPKNKAMRQVDQGYWTNTLYDAMKGAEINIKGGYFYSDISIGIYFNISGAPTNFKISGGTFERGSWNNLFHSNNDVLLSDILADGYNLYISDAAVDNATKINDISGKIAVIKPVTPTTES